MVRMGSPARFRPLIRWRFRLIGANGWGRGEVRVRPRTAVQAPGQAVGVLASLPPSGLPGFLELNHTVPASQPHSAPDPNRTIQRAHGGPPDWVEVLQRVGRGCHGRIILTPNTTRKTSREDRFRGRGRSRHPGHPDEPWSPELLGPRCLRAESYGQGCDRPGPCWPMPSPTPPVV
jgi:hypothetical protein